jgi:putative DNA primase/helicase
MTSTLPLIILSDKQTTAKLNELGLRALCIPDPNRLNGHFGSDDVILIPDNSDAGYEYINAIGVALTSHANSISVVRLSSDLRIWLRDGGTAEQLRAAISNAVEWVPLPPDSDSDQQKRAKAEAAEQQLIDELARLNPRNYDRRRMQAASEMGIRAGTLDNEVRARRDAKQHEVLEPPLVGHWLVEPWDAEVDGDTLLTNLVECIQRHMIVSHYQAVAVALWIVMTWAHGEAATHSPVLLVTSAVPGEGKTQLLGLISFLACRGFVITDPTPASIYQFAETYEPTLCIDDADDIFAGAQKLRAVINSSWVKNTAFVTRGTARGKARRYTIWCPKAFGMIGRKMPASTLERCIIVEIKKKLPDEQVEKFRQVDRSEFEILRRQSLRWTADNMSDLRETASKLSDGFGGVYNRASDNWTLQIAIAHLAGGKWPELALGAATATAAAITADNKALPVQLLGDIRDVFENLGITKIHSDPLTAALVALEDRPWAHFRGNRPLTKWQLAALLKPFKISPDSVRVDDTILNGYHLRQFDDAFARYLTK